MTQNMIDLMNEVFDVQSHSVLQYVTSQAWPTVIDPLDQKAMEAMNEAWAIESGFADRIYDMIEAEGTSPFFGGTYRFAPGRLNFARASHLIGVLAPLVQEEIETLRSLNEGTDGAWKELVDRLIDAKSRGLTLLEDARKAKEKKEVAAAEAAASATPVAAAAAAPAGDDDMPWRDADMPLDERMEHVKNGTKEEKLWAAMAQTDCTACGYDCEGYAMAIASGEDTDLSKCVPGEDETANMLAQIMQV